MYCGDLCVSFGATEHLKSDEIWKVTKDYRNCTTALGGSGTQLLVCPLSVSYLPTYLRPIPTRTSKVV